MNINKQNFKRGDKVIFVRKFDKYSKEFKNVGYAESYKNLELNKVYTVSNIMSHSILVNDENCKDCYPNNSFELADNLIIKIDKLKLTLTDSNISIRTINSEQRSILKKIILQLKLPYSSTLLKTKKELNHSNGILYSLWGNEIVNGKEEYSIGYIVSKRDNTIVIDFEDLIEPFNEFKNNK